MKSHALASFWKRYEALPKHVQQLADKNFALLQGKPAASLVRLPEKGGVHTVEVGRSYRAIARERRGEYY